MKNLMQQKFETRLPRPKPEDGEWVSDAGARKPKAAPVMARTMSGETDVSHDWNRAAVADGYKRLPMKPTDDTYTDEHVAPFYSPRIVDGDEGFVENNNTLDRL